jgi:hypothetical protein
MRFGKARYLGLPLPRTSDLASSNRDRVRVVVKKFVSLGILGLNRPGEGAFEKFRYLGF